MISIKHDFPQKDKSWQVILQLHVKNRLGVCENMDSPPCWLANSYGALEKDQVELKLIKQSMEITLLCFDLLKDVYLMIVKTLRKDIYISLWSQLRIPFLCQNICLSKKKNLMKNIYKELEESNPSFKQVICPNR